MKRFIEENGVLVLNETNSNGELQPVEGVVVFDYISYKETPGIFVIANNGEEFVAFFAHENLVVLEEAKPTFVMEASDENFVLLFEQDDHWFNTLVYYNNGDYSWTELLDKDEYSLDDEFVLKVFASGIPLRFISDEDFVYMKVAIEDHDNYDINQEDDEEENDFLYLISVNEEAELAKVSLIYDDVIEEEDTYFIVNTIADCCGYLLRDEDGCVFLFTLEFKNEEGTSFYSLEQPLLSLEAENGEFVDAYDYFDGEDYKLLVVYKDADGLSSFVINAVDWTNDEIDNSLIVVVDGVSKKFVVIEGKLEFFIMADDTECDCNGECQCGCDGDCGDDCQCRQ
ncbi:MAG: hypothetical protein R3Y43_03275 [Alphaproteobacteria bacterium]